MASWPKSATLIGIQRSKWSPDTVGADRRTTEACILVPPEWAVSRDKGTDQGTDTGTDMPVLQAAITSLQVAF